CGKLRNLWKTFEFGNRKYFCGKVRKVEKSACICRSECIRFPAFNSSPNVKLKSARPGRLGNKGRRPHHDASRGNRLTTVPPLLVRGHLFQPTTNPFGSHRLFSSTPRIGGRVIQSE